MAPFVDPLAEKAVGAPGAVASAGVVDPVITNPVGIVNRNMPTLSSPDGPGSSRPNLLGTLQRHARHQGALRLFLRR